MLSIQPFLCNCSENWIFKLKLNNVNLHVDCIILFFQIFRLHNVMFGVVILVVSIVCLAMLVLITVHVEADDDDD